MQRRVSFFERGCGVVNTDAGAVHHYHVNVVHVGHRIHDLIPNTCIGPPIEAVVDSRVGAVFAGQVAPWDARAKHVENAVNDAPIIHPFHAARLVRQNLLDEVPLQIAHV